MKQHVLLDLNQFIHAVGSYRNNQRKLTSTSLIRTSLHLLEDLPAARDIIFEYFSLVAEASVQNYVANANVDTQTGLPLQKGNNNSSSIIEDTYFCNIQQALENLVAKGPSAWAPLIASWSLDLVGSLSDKYTKRKMSIGAACNYWLNCYTMRGLLTLINLCFRKLSSSDAEIWVETLIAAFKRYSVSFDWIVARLGGCFPLKIVSQILQCSLKHFADDVRCRFDSEIGILEYLSFAHEKEVRAALREILQEGFQPKKNLDVSIIPFVMVLTNYSDVLLQNLVNVFLEIYNDDLRTTIIQKAPLWMSNKLFAEMQPSLNNVALRLKAHGAQLLISVAKMSEQYSWCQDFVEFSLQELEQIIMNVHMCPLIDDLSTEQSKYLLWKSCISSNIFEQQTAVRLLLIVSTHHSHIYYQTISELLRKSYELNYNAMGAVIRIMGGQSGIVEFPDIKQGIQMVLEEVLLQEQFPSVRLPSSYGTSEALNTFKNLNILTKLQKKNCISQMKQHVLMITLNDCLPKILQILEVTLTSLNLQVEDNFNSYQTNDLEIRTNDTIKPEIKEEKRIKNSELSDETEERMQFDCAGSPLPVECEKQESYANRLVLTHTIIELLNTIEAGSKSNVIRTTEVLKLAVLTVKYLFVSLAEKSITLRNAAAHRAYIMLQRQCCRKAARTACLRELVEGALFYYGYLFGQYEEPSSDELEIPDHEMVLMQNQRHSLATNSNRSVLHAGVIGRGLRSKNNLSSSVSNECELQRQQLFLRALDACCADADKQNAIEGYTMISLLLVEMVSTDVMYNGLPFPDEEFAKVTMERDLLIRRAFSTSPILWTLLGFIATHRPALCFSSVLLRALCATCLHQWRAKNVNKLQPFNRGDELMQCTKQLLEILSLGQLLPPPLSHLHVIIEHFEAAEISLILKECIWNYLKDHVPSPALFQIDNSGLHWRNSALAKVPPQYVDTLRNLMQKKLPKLGQDYHQMFIMSEVNNISNPTESEVTTAAPPFTGDPME